MFEMIQTFVLLLYIGMSQPLIIGGYLSKEACNSTGSGAIKDLPICHTEHRKCRHLCIDGPKKTAVKKPGALSVPLPGARVPPPVVVE